MLNLVKKIGSKREMELLTRKIRFIQTYFLKYLFLSLSLSLW